MSLVNGAATSQGTSSNILLGEEVRFTMCSHRLNLPQLFSRLEQVCLSFFPCHLNLPRRLQHLLWQPSLVLSVLSRWSVEQTKAKNNLITIKPERRFHMQPKGCECINGV